MDLSFSAGERAFEKEVRDFIAANLTPEMKRLMLGGTQARIMNLDVAGMKRIAATDEFANRNTLAEPWTSGKRAA